MLLLGGTASIYGPILGAFVITLLSEAMVELGPWRFLIISSLIILTMVFYPGGIISALGRVRHLVWRPNAPGGRAPSASE